MGIARRNLLRWSILVMGSVPLVPLAGCGHGNNANDIIVAPMIKASFDDTSCTDPCSSQSDPKVFLDNVTTAGNVLNADVMVQDSSGLLDVDDIDLVMRYDATFMQLTSIRPETLLGTCGTVNPVCQVLSPVCINNQSAANGGGERFCRGNGSTPCLRDTDCTTTDDVCGDFGRLQASFAVITGPKTCSNKPSQSCTQSSDCQFCASNPSQACLNAAICTGSCTSFVCAGGSFDGKPCSSGIDCFDACGSGACSGCPSTLVNGKVRIVNLTFSVIGTGSSDLRFTVSTNPSATACALRKDTVDIGSIHFCPDVDAADPGITHGCFKVTGTK